MAVKDPVCGMTIEESEAFATVVHEGTTYSFCSQHCKEAFEANPGDYTG